MSRKKGGTADRNLDTSFLSYGSYSPLINKINTSGVKSNFNLVSGGAATLQDVYETKYLGYSKDYVPYFTKYGPVPYQPLSPFSLYSGGGKKEKEITKQLNLILRKHYKDFKKKKGGDLLAGNYPDLVFGEFKKAGMITKERFI